ncbi:MAG: ester cyclase [Elusimicrobia bacterium]|nr:ester cyclase [Elusimicrobiota bacterium]
MNKVTRTGIGLAAVLAAVAIGTFSGCGKKEGYSAEMQAKIDEMQKITDEMGTVETNLKTFDELDFKVFSGQQWARLHESHSKDVVVNWPDGHHTNGIDKHIEDLKALFVYAPDTRIVEHPIRFGSKEWTCVTGFMLGTFTKPMPIGGGKFIPPTGKKFNVPMCTVGHWVNGVMTEEWLYWDNATYMKQIGLGK